jgi:hypothetical protein
MRDSIFHSTQEMPPKENSPDVVKTAQDVGTLRAQNYMPSSMPSSRASVENIQRPRRGHGY